MTGKCLENNQASGNRCFGTTTHSLSSLRVTVTFGARRRINTTPTPFVFRLSDGTRVPVVHPDFVAVSPGQVVVIGQDEGLTRIDPLHVVAIEEAPPKKRSNGKRSG
jgi:hypothetical protein